MNYKSLGLSLLGACLALGLMPTMAALPRTNSALPDRAWLDYRYQNSDHGVLRGRQEVPKIQGAIGESQAQKAVLESVIRASDNWAGILILNREPSNIRVNFPLPIQAGGLSEFNGNINYGLAFQAGSLNVLSMPVANADMDYKGGYIFHGKKYASMSPSWLRDEMKKTIEGGQSSVPFLYRSAQKLDLPYKANVVYYGAQSKNGGIIYKYTTDFMLLGQKDRAYSIDMIQNNTDQSRSYVDRALDMYSNYIVPSARPANLELKKLSKATWDGVHIHLPDGFGVDMARRISNDQEVYESAHGTIRIEKHRIPMDQSRQDLVNESLSLLQRVSPEGVSYETEEVTGSGRYRAMINHNGQVGIYIETLRRGGDYVDTWTRMIHKEAYYDLKGHIEAQEFIKHKALYRDCLTTLDVEEENYGNH